ncbi:MAG: hypothetical protein A2066_14840 [Bacteroidetes bacterium GWB2_41_8]|nr:MAG: hypothetical protein A2066_14840 [Bacteroidetes bacterium GWB2_41_8]
MLNKYKEDMRVLVIYFLLLISGNVMAQNAINQLDAMGRKQGFWTKKDAAGKLLYQATFKDDKPVGEMKRFHPNGKIKAVLKFIDGSELSDVNLFDEAGRMIAQGKYTGQNKTGEWSYFQDSKIISTETYLKGQKSGISKRFYKTGELLEESNWLNDQLHGVYRSYFQDGKPNLECSYSAGKRNGSFKTWFPNGSPELDAFYTDDVRDLDWKYFDETEKLRYVLKYKLGELLNPEVQDSIDRQKSDILQLKDENIPDPEKFIQDPAEYMRLMRIR